MKNIKQYLLLATLALAATAYSQPIEYEVRQATNPLIKGDVPDPSIVRVGDAYYMVSTTMYYCPVAPIMKSYDLVNWRIVSYVTDILENNDRFNLASPSSTAYGQGQWAASLRYFNDRFYVLFSSLTTGRTYLFRTANADTGPWERVATYGYYHDPSLFYDESTGRMWIIEGGSNQQLVEMRTDLSGVLANGVNKRILTEVGEGAHVYKRGNYYYIFIIAWRPGQRAVWCYRSTNIEGPYTEKLVLNRSIDGGGGVAQGGIIETPDGEWYGFFFQDRGAVGRVPVLVPMTWSSDGWPEFGASSGGNTGTIPMSFNIKQAKNFESNLYYSDNFDSDKLHLAWQWNHNPDNDNWSLTERPGYMRLKAGRTAKNIYYARNTLTQRTFEPLSSAEVALETTNMKDGDIAGLVALQAISGFVGIEQEGTQKYVVMYTGDHDSEPNRGANATVTRRERVAFGGDKVYLRARFRSSPARVQFEYSLNGQNWQRIGVDVNPGFSLQHFVGVRFGLFNYATKTAGGHVDFDYYHVWAGDGNKPDGLDPPLCEGTAPSPTPGNLVADGIFPGTGLGTSWSMAGLMNGAAATASVRCNKATVAITSIGEEDYQPQLIQQGIKLEQGKAYTLTFRASAAGARTMIAQLERLGGGEDDLPWGHMYGTKSFSLTTAEQTFTLDFDMNDPTDERAQLAFNFGGSTQDVTISDVVLIASGTSPVNRGNISVNKTARPSVSVNGKTLNVIIPPQMSSSSPEPMRIRLIDTKGKVRANYTATGSAKFSLKKIPAGRYFVEVKGAGGVRQTVPVVVR